MSKLEGVVRCEEIVTTLNELVKMMGDDPKWGGFTQEMLEDYKRSLAELQEDYWTSAEYLEFEPTYSDRMIREHVMFLR